MLTLAGSTLDRASRWTKLSGLFQSPVALRSFFKQLFVFLMLASDVSFGVPF